MIHLFYAQNLGAYDQTENLPALQQANAIFNAEEPPSNVQTFLNQSASRNSLFSTVRVG